MQFRQQVRFKTFVYFTVHIFKMAYEFVCYFFVFLVVRCLYPVSSRGQQVDEDADDVSKLPDIVGS